MLDNKYVIVYNLGRWQETRPNYFFAIAQGEPLMSILLKVIVTNTPAANNAAVAVANANDAAAKAAAVYTNLVERYDSGSNDYVIEAVAKEYAEAAIAAAEEAATAAAEAAKAAAKATETYNIIQKYNEAVKSAIAAAEAAAYGAMQ